MKLPKAVNESVLDIGGMKLRVYVLDNGQRVFDANDFERFFANLANIDLTEEEAIELAKAIRE